jgi:trehalose 6-phosphate synthase
MFAEAVLDEIGGKKAFVFIQDYHLALLSRLIKTKNKKAVTAQFWHIPWPNPEAFRICPWQEEMLDGLLGNNLIGFHIAYHRNNFLETVNRTLECKIDYERYAVSRHGTTTLARSFPISIDFDRTARNASREEVGTEIKLIREQWGITDQFIGIGIDRIDYTKGIPERLKSLDLFLTKYPQYLGKVVFFQLGEPSRIHIKEYNELNAEVNALVEEINWKYRSGNRRPFEPIIYLRGHMTQAELSAYYRMADFCIVSSLHDGMNLVAKEYVASRIAEDGVLILSKFTGASRELTEALLINPYALNDIAEAIKEAIEMPKETQRMRMVKLQETIKDNNIYRWGGEIISEMVKFGES